MSPYNDLRLSPVSELPHGASCPSFTSLVLSFPEPIGKCALKLCDVTETPSPSLLIDILSKALVRCRSIGHVEAPGNASLGSKLRDGCAVFRWLIEFWVLINHASCGGNQKAVQEYTVTESDLEQRRQIMLVLCVTA